MDLILHIVIALTSVIYTGYLYFAPSHAKFRLTYVLVGLTIASGTWLIIAHPAYMVRSCVAGLAYLSAVFFAIALARRKLTAEVGSTRDE